MVPVTPTAIPIVAPVLSVVGVAPVLSVVGALSVLRLFGGGNSVCKYSCEKVRVFAFVISINGVIVIMMLMLAVE